MVKAVNTVIAEKMGARGINILSEAGLDRDRLGSFQAEYPSDT
jgi:predicted Fe-Mo cluster-binding NifX family protein